MSTGERGRSRFRARAAIPRHHEPEEGGAYAFLQEQFIALILIGTAAGVAAGYLLRRHAAEKGFSDAEAQAKKIVEEAQREASNKAREAELFAKDELHRSRTEFERETKNRRKELLTLEQRVLQKEENVERKVGLIEKKEQMLSKTERELQERERKAEARQAELDGIIEEERRRLQKVAGLSRDEAKQLLLSKLEDEIRRDAATMARRIEEEAKESADKQAKKIISSPFNATPPTMSPRPRSRACRSPTTR